MGLYTMLMTLLLFGCISCSEFPLSQYYYVNQALNWSDAQQYCREKYTDLATFESMDDLKRLKAKFTYTWAWIGLHDDPAAWKTSMGNESNSWRWSATGQTSRTGFESWNHSTLDYFQGQETCGVMTKNGLWNDDLCGLSFSFLCINVTDQNKKNYIFINQQYCRKNYKDLAMIENLRENTEAQNAKPSSSTVWIGLYREPWTWSDGSLSSFRNWYPTGLNNYGGSQHCVTENPQHHWVDDFCDIPWVFVCHQVSKLKTTFRMTFITDADLTDPKVKAQILQQLHLLLSSDGGTDVKLQWTIEPKK